MAKSNSRGGGVVIRRTNGRVTKGTNTALGKRVGQSAIGSPTSTSGKHSIPAKTHVAPRTTS